METINAAIIGFGMAGRVFHAPIINSLQEINLKKIYTNNPQNGDYIRSYYPDTVAISNLEEILHDEKIHLVVIASPNLSHYTLAQEAIKSRKHVVVDKPFTVTSFEADRLITDARENNVVLSAFHNRRWDSDFKTIQKMIQSGLLGKLVECEIHMDRFRNFFKNTWKEENLSGSGLLFDLGPHMIDQAVALFGYPSSITADLRKQRENSKEIDNFELILHYDKIKVTLKAGMLVKIPLPHFVLLGENGSFVKYGMDPQEEDLMNGFNPLNKKDWGREPKELFGTISTNVNGINLNGKVDSERGDYRDFYINIHRAITGEEELAVTPQQARNTIRIIEFAMESNQTKSTVEIKELW